MNTPPQEVNRDSTNIAIIMEIAMLVFGFLPPLLVFLFKKEDQFLLEQSKESLNASINIIVARFIAGFIIIVGGLIASLINSIMTGLITILVVGVPLFLAIYAYALIICLQAAIENSNSRIYQFPYILRLIH